MTEHNDKAAGEQVALDNRGLIAEVDHQVPGNTDGGQESKTIMKENNVNRTVKNSKVITDDEFDGVIYNPPEDDVIQFSFPAEKRLENLKAKDWLVWKRNIRDYILDAAVYLSGAARYAMHGGDNDFSKYIQPPEADSEYERNLSRERKDQFSRRLRLVMRILTSAVSGTIRRTLERDERFDELIGAGDAKGLWELIREMVIKKDQKSGISLYQAWHDLFGIKQGPNEPFDDFALRIVNLTKEIELLGDNVDNKVIAQVFIRGLHDTFDQVKRDLLGDTISEIDVEHLSIWDLSTRAQTKSFRIELEEARLREAALEEARLRKLTAAKSKGRKRQRFGGECWNCGQPGHQQATCQARV